MQFWEGEFVLPFGNFDVTHYLLTMLWKQQAI
jgi:hypothetical protein